MSTAQTFLPFDSSTDGAFQTWAGGISAQLANAGYRRLTDTGQAVFSVTTLTFTQVAVGATAVYSYSSYTGPDPRVGMSIIITGFATGGNNVTATITAASGGASGTVTVALTTQANETHAGTGVTTLSASPNSTYVYELWQPPSTDSLQTGATAYYVKMEYGNNGNKTQPLMRTSIGISTNGAGTFTGSPTTVFSNGSINNTGANQGPTVLYECSFSYDTGGRFGMLLWRNAGSRIPRFIGWERTKDTSGVDSSDGVTLIDTFQGDSSLGRQVTYVFSASGPGNISINPIALESDRTNTTAASSDSFNNQIPISPIFPSYGKFGNPMTIAAMCHINDVAEGALITTTLYGASRTYMAARGNGGNLYIGTLGPQQAQRGFLARYD